MPRLFAILVFAALTSACTADSGDEGILITKIVAPGDNCTFTAIETETFLPSGVLQLGNYYMAFPQMTSRITAQTGQELQRTVIVQEADVDIAFDDTTLFTKDQLTMLKTSGVTHFKAVFSAPIAPNGGIADSGFELIPTSVSDAITAQKPDAATDPTFTTHISATFTVKGNMSGESVSSQPFVYGVQIVNQGLFNSLGDCPATGQIRKGNTCHLGQDFTVDCCGPADNPLQTCPATM